MQRIIWGLLQVSSSSPNENEGGKGGMIAANVNSSPPFSWVVHSLKRYNGQWEGENVCISFRVDSRGCTDSDSILVKVFSIVRMMCRIVGGDSGACDFARIFKTSCCGWFADCAKKISQAGIASPRASR